MFLSLVRFVMSRFTHNTVTSFSRFDNSIRILCLRYRPHYDVQFVQCTTNRIEIYSVIHDRITFLVGAGAATVAVSVTFIVVTSPLCSFFFVLLINSLESSSVCYFIPKNYWHELCDNCINIQYTCIGRHWKRCRRRHHRTYSTEFLMNLFFFLPLSSFHPIHS